MRSAKVRGSMRPPAPPPSRTITPFTIGQLASRASTAEEENVARSCFPTWSVSPRAKSQGSLQPSVIFSSWTVFVRRFASFSQRSKRSLQKDFSLAASSPVEDCRSSEDYSALKQIIACLDEPHFAVDFSTYICLLKYCRKAEALHDGARVHRHIIRSNLQQDLYLVSLLILMYTDCGALIEAHDAFIGLSTRDEFAFTVILRTYAQLESPCFAFQTFEQMLQEGLIPNKRIYISIFTAGSKQLAIIQGKRIHACFLGSTHRADIATNTALVNMYNRCRNFDYARWIFNNMEELDAVAWNVMIASCLEQSQGKYALELFRIMQQQGVILSKVTVIHILDACSSEIALFKGLQLHCSILGSDVESDIMVQTALITMYSCCGKISLAEKIFAKVETKDEVVWSAMIAVYSQGAQVRSAVHLYQRMLLEGMILNKYVLSSILSGCAVQLLPAIGKQMHACMSCAGFSLDGALANALITFYGKTMCLDESWKAFHKINVPDLVSWNAIIGACAEHGHLEEACQIFCELLQEGMLADRAAFLSAITACANQGALSEGQKLHARITASEFHGDLNVDNALLNMYGKCGQLNYMHSIFEGMPVKNLISWNTLLGVCTQHGMDKKALKLFQEMQDAGIAPDRSSFTSVLCVCANQGAFDEGKRLHEDFKSRGFQPDQVVGSALVSLYGKCGSLQEARNVFDTMPECDIVIWNALITAFSQNGQGEEVLEMFECMQQNKIIPTGVTFISVLSSCSHVGLVDEACHHFHAMQMCYDIEPVTDHYNCLIDLFGRAGRLAHAEQIFNVMPTDPTEATMMTLLGACRNELDYHRAERVAEKVFKLDTQSPSPYVMLSNIYALIGGDDALTVMHSMQKNQVTFKPDRYMGVLNG